MDGRGHEPAPPLRRDEAAGRTWTPGRSAENGACLTAVGGPQVRAPGAGRRVDRTTAALREHLRHEAAGGRRVLGYGAASRAVPLLVAAGVGPDLLRAVADASPAKQGRLIPGVGIPVISPAELVAAAPDEVLLFLPDLLDEVRAALPELESAGARWRSVETLMQKGHRDIGIRN